MQKPQSHRKEDCCNTESLTEDGEDGLGLLVEGPSDVNSDCTLPNTADDAISFN